MTKDTKIIKANDPNNGKCAGPNLKKDTKCDCAIEKFENKNYSDYFSTNYFSWILKFALITLFIYLVFTLFSKSF
jgi:hypothetical protein